MPLGLAQNPYNTVFENKLKSLTRQIHHWNNQKKMMIKRCNHYFDTDQSWKYRDELQHEWHRFCTCNGAFTSSKFQRSPGLQRAFNLRNKNKIKLKYPMTIKVKRMVGNDLRVMLELSRPTRTNYLHINRC